MASESRWKVVWAETAKGDLLTLKANEIRPILKTVEKLLSEDPLANTKRMKTLKPNSVAQRQVRILEKYRVLFDVDLAEREVMIHVVGVKDGSKLLVRGKEYRNHESNLP